MPGLRSLRSNLLVPVGAVLAVVVTLAGPARGQDFPIEPFPEPKPAEPKLTKPPKMLKAAEPVYPPEALEAKLGADVTITIDLDAEGKVTRAEVDKPVGHGFDEAAVAAVKASTFSPAEVDGKPSAIRFSYTLHFVPKVVPAAPPEPPPEPEPPPPPPPPPPQPIVVRGRIREKGTRDPIRNADVAIKSLAPEAATEEARVVTTSDPDGRFEIQAAPGVALRVIVADGVHADCIRDIDGIALRPDNPAEIDCMVVKRRTSYETRVTAPRETQSATRYTLSQPELTTVPGTFGDPLRVVQNLPGVARSPFGLGLLVIRGAAPQDSGVFIEGHQIPILYHFLGGPSVLTPRLIDRVDFFPGNFGVQYGRFSAGIIDIGVKTDPTPRLHGTVDINSIDSSVYVEGPLGAGWTGAVSARRSYIDVLLPFLLPSNTITAAPVYWDYQAGVHRDFLGGRLSLFAFGSDDTLKVVSTDPAQTNFALDTETGFHRLLAVWAKNLAGWINKLSPALGYDKLVLNAGAVDINRSAYIGELRDELTRPFFGSRLTLRLGFDGQVRRDSVFFNLPTEPDARLYGPTMVTYQQGVFPLGTQAAALYADATWDVGRGVRLIPGVRGDYFRYVGQDRFTFDPRLVARWKTSASQTFKAGIGLFHQMPEPQLLNPTFGSPDLPPIVAAQYSVGIERALTRLISLDATAYLVYRYDEPVAVPGTPPFQPNGEQRSYGLELIVKHAFTERFYGWLAYTLSRSEETATQVNAPTTAGMGNLPASGAPTWSPTAFDQTHNLVLIASYVVRGWTFGAKIRLVTGSPTTLLQEGYFDADHGDYVCRQQTANGARQPTFFQADARIERKWVFNAWQLSTYADIWNVTNNVNAEATVYDYRCRGSAPIRGVPLFPVLGIRGLF